MMDHPEDCVDTTNVNTVWEASNVSDFPFAEDPKDVEPEGAFVGRSDDCESPGPISLFNTISLQLKSYVPDTKTDVSEESNTPLRPRTRLLLAGLLAFVAWGIAMAVFLQNIHTNYPEPTDAVVRVLNTLTSESERLRERLHAPWQSYRFPAETPIEPRTPESLFGPDEITFLDSYIAAHPVEPSPPLDGSLSESLPGLPGPPDTSESQEDSTQDSSARDSSASTKSEPEQMSAESKRLVEEMMQYRLEGNMELARALSRYPDDSEAMLVVANYLHYFSQPMEASRAGQLALDLLKPIPQHNESASTPIGNEKSTEETTGENVADKDNNALLRNQIWILLGNISMETDQPETAVTLFQQSSLMERSIRGTATDATLLSLAESQLAANDPVGARKSLGPLLTDHPRCLAALTLRGRAWFQEGNRTAAMEDFRTVTELAPDLPETMVAWLGLALCAAYQDDPTDALAAMTAFRKLREQSSLPEYERSNSDREGAIDIAPSPPTEAVCREELRQVRKKLAVVFVQLAALYSRNELLQTDRLLRRAVEIDEQCESAYLLTSTIFARQLLMDEAIRTLETGNWKIESGALAFELARLYQQQGHTDQVGIWLQRATERAPRTARYHAALAAWYLDQLKTLSPRPRQMVDSAVLQAMTAVELDPIAANYMVMAAALAAGGDAKSARTAIMKSIELEPENQEYQNFLMELTTSRQDGNQ